MRILFDHNTPRPLRRHLAEHTVHTAGQRGWDRLANGNLLAQAEIEGYELLITADQSMRHQQNLSRRRIAVIVLGDNRWSIVRLRIPEIRAALDGISPGEFREVPIPDRREII